MWWPKMWRNLRSSLWTTKMPHILPRTKECRLWCEMREARLQHHVPRQSLWVQWLPKMRNHLQTPSLCHSLPSFIPQLIMLRSQNQFVKQFAMNQSATGSARSPNAQNQNVNLCVKTQIADQLTNVANVKLELPLLEQESQCSRKWNQTNNAASVMHSWINTILRKS